VSGVLTTLKRAFFWAPWLLQVCPNVGRNAAAQQGFLTHCTLVYTKCRQQKEDQQKTLGLNPKKQIQQSNMSKLWNHTWLDE
jgi:hypothetical protein